VIAQLFRVVVWRREQGEGDGASQERVRHGQRAGAAERERLAFLSFFLLPSCLMDLPFDMQKMNDQCFKKCVAKPGSRLDSSESVKGLFSDSFFLLFRLNSFFSFFDRPVFPSAWIATWKHGTLWQRFMPPGCRGSNIEELQNLLFTKNEKRNNRQKRIEEDIVCGVFTTA